MSDFLLRPLRFLVQILAGNDSPRQTAWGFSLGMLVGMLPKGTLVAIVLAMLLCALRINRTAGLLAVGLFSMLGSSLDPFAHHLGALALTWPMARGAFTWLYDKPLGPLVGFNNTVVMGQLLIGFYLFYPTYTVGHALGVHVQPRVHDWLMRRRVIRWMRGAEIGAQWSLE